MNFGFLIRKFTALTLVLTALGGSLAAQQMAPSTAKPPRQEKLLNGLKTLMWSDPAAADVSVRIRIHAGSAFDPQGKEGVMQLLAENIFPNDALREFFTEDLGGTLDITTSYDYIQISASSKPEEFLNLLETLANSVANPTIDKETTAKLKAMQLEKIAVLEKNPAYVADQLAAQRLVGTFPYGRRAAGTPESLQKIDFADILFAKQRFLTPDNATVTISGNFKSDLGYRAARRYFGAWVKSDKLTPSNFRQPDAPDTKMLTMPNEAAKDAEIRFALRGIARNDKDFAASKILTVILNKRLRDFALVNNATDISVRQGENVLPGIIIFGYKSAAGTSPTAPANNADSGKPADSAPSIASLLISKPVSADEFNQAKAIAAAEINKKNYFDWWLDVDTFKIASVAAEADSFSRVSPADVQRVAERLYKNPVVSVTLVAADKTTSKN